MYFLFSIPTKIIILLIFLFVLTYTLNIYNYGNATHTSTPILNFNHHEIYHPNQKIKFDGWVSYYGQPTPNVFLDIVVSHSDNKNKNTSQIIGTIKSNIEGNFSFFLVFQNAGNYDIKIISKCWSEHIDICDNNETIKLNLTIVNSDIEKNKSSFVNSKKLINLSSINLFVYPNKIQNQLYYSNVTKGNELIKHLSVVCYNRSSLEEFFPVLINNFDIKNIYVKDKDNNMIKGSINNDFICSNSDNSTIISDNGNDIIMTGKGNDIIFSGIGNDTIYSMEGNDKVFGGLGYDIINGGKGNDYVHGNGGYDILYDNQGNNKINGGKGFDYCGNGNISNCEFILK